MGSPFGVPWRTGSFERGQDLANLCQMVDNMEEIRIIRQGRYVELRFSGLDDSVTQEEVLTAMADSTGCHTGKLDVGEISLLESSWLCVVPVFRRGIQ